MRYFTKVMSVLALDRMKGSGGLGLISKFFVCILVVCSFAIKSECVLRLPEFAEPIKNVTLQTGSDVEFSCDVRHLGTYRVAWSWRKGQDEKFLAIGIVKIVSDSRIHISRIQKSDDVTQFNLYVYNIKREDAGTYHCSVNSNPMIEQIGMLDVTGEEYANGNNGKIVNGKSLSIPLKPVRKGSFHPISEDIQDDTIPDSSTVSPVHENGAEQILESPYNSNARSALMNESDDSTSETSGNNSTSADESSPSTFCIDLGEIWEDARERIVNFFSALMKLTYSYLFS